MTHAHEPYMAVAINEDDQFVYDDIEALISDQAGCSGWQVGDCVAYWLGTFLPLSAFDTLAGDVDNVADNGLEGGLAFARSLIDRMGQFVETYYPDETEAYPNLAKSKIKCPVIMLDDAVRKAINGWALEAGLHPELHRMEHCSRQAVRIESLDPLKLKRIHIVDIDESDDDDGAWNNDGSGNPSPGLVYQALATWLVTGDRNGSASVRDAAIALGATDDVILRVAKQSDGMGLEGFLGLPEHKCQVYVTGDPNLIRANLPEMYWYVAVQCLSIAMGRTEGDGYISPSVIDLTNALGTYPAHIRSICSGPYLTVDDNDRIQHEGE